MKNTLVTVAVTCSAFAAGMAIGAAIIVAMLTGLGAQDTLHMVTGYDLSHAYVIDSATGDLYDGGTVKIDDDGVPTVIIDTSCTR